jgi:hypothetical protein
LNVPKELASEGEGSRYRVAICTELTWRGEAKKPKLLIALVNYYFLSARNSYFIAFQPHFQAAKVELVFSISPVHDKSQH